MQIHGFLLWLQRGADLGAWLQYWLWAVYYQSQSIIVKIFWLVIQFTMAQMQLRYLSGVEEG